MHTEIICWSATAPGASGAAAAAFSGDSLTIKNDRSTKGARVLDLWAFNNASGFLQFAPPSGHDTNRGFRVGVEAGRTDYGWAMGGYMDVTSQETVLVTQAGSAVGGEKETGCASIFYPELPGIESRSISWDELKRRWWKPTTLFATVTPASGAYAEEVITADSDLLKGNTDYALLGFSTTVDCLAVFLRGADTANMRVGAPGADDQANFSQGYFGTLARAHDLPLIPILNSGNKNNTYIGVAQNQVSTDVIVTAQLVMLRPK